MNSMQLHRNQYSQKDLLLHRNGASPTMVLIFLTMFTASFDIFLVINVGGFNVRATQLFSLLPILASIGGLFMNPKSILPLGYKYLCIWTLFILLFVPHTEYLSRNISYAGWLVYSVILIFSFVQIFNTYDRAEKLLKVYIYSFFFAATFGLIQFFLAVTHIAAPLVIQWWIPGKLPRVNGFNYEPSYYSTYMLTGWVLMMYLLDKKCYIIPKNKFNIILLVTTMALLLSTSRIGWFMMGLWYARYGLLFIGRLLKGKINVTYFMKIFKPAVLLSIVVLFVLATSGFSKFYFLLNGTGLLGSHAGSTDTRSNRTFETFEIFTQSPIIGYSLGGLPSAIGKSFYGTEVVNQQEAKILEGNTVFVEVLAASGIIGFFFFAMYIFKLIKEPLKLSKRFKDEEQSHLLVGMVLSLVFLLIILQFNQNILRQYLWIHISILSVVYYASYKKLNTESKQSNEN